MTKHYTTEDIRRLVPEHDDLTDWEEVFNKLVETRARLEVAVEALEQIGNGGNGQGDMAFEALSKIEEMQDE